MDKVLIQEDRHNTLFILCYKLQYYSVQVGFFGIERDKDTNTQTERQTNTQIERWTNEQGHRGKETERKR